STLAFACDNLNQISGPVFDYDRQLLLFAVDGCGRIFGGFLKGENIHKEVCEKLEKQAQTLRRQQSELISRCDEIRQKNTACNNGNGQKQATKAESSS